MNDFQKCECPHCGQSIEYPSEGTGQTVPCPTCEKPITLTIAIQKQVKEYLPINAERNEWGALNEPQNHAVQIPAKGSIQKAEMVSIPATEPASIVFKRVCSAKEPKIPKYLHYPPEPRPQDYNSGSDYDVVAENKKWMREVKETEAINRRLFVVHRAKFKLWNAKHNWGEDAWLPSSFPKSPLAPSDSEEVELQKALLDNMSLATDSPLKKSEPEARRKARLRTTGRVGNTLLHKAARNGTLNQVPRELLTKENLTIVAKPSYAPEGFYFTGSGYKAKTETVLHIAALYGHGDQIPVEFLTPDLLSIEAKGHAQTVLHYFALSKSLELIPKIYDNSEMWNIKDRQGFTPRKLQEALIAQEAYVAQVRTEPATEKQKEKLRWFGCTFDEGMTKGQASDALDKCVRDFPEKESAYYSRPATEEQMAKLRSYYGKNLDEVDGPFTYGKVKDLIWERDMEKRHSDRVAEFEKMDYEFTILEFLRWRADHYRHLTYSRVKKAARALDKINPGWSKLGNCQDLLLEKVTGLFPELAAKEGWS